MTLDSSALAWPHAHYPPLRQYIRMQGFEQINFGLFCTSWRHAGASAPQNAHIVCKELTDDYFPRKRTQFKSIGG